MFYNMLTITCICFWLYYRCYNSIECDRSSNKQTLKCVLLRTHQCLDDLGLRVGGKSVRLRRLLIQWANIIDTQYKLSCSFRQNVNYTVAYKNYSLGAKENLSLFTSGGTYIIIFISNYIYRSLCRIHYYIFHLFSFQYPKYFHILHCLARIILWLYSALQLILVAQYFSD